MMAASLAVLAVLAVLDILAVLAVEEAVVFITTTAIL